MPSTTHCTAPESMHQLLVVKIASMTGRDPVATVGLDPYWLQTKDIYRLRQVGVNAQKSRA